MKRTQINAALETSMDIANRFEFKLPDFAHWQPSDWRTKGAEFDEVRGAMLGWDVTDFGSGDFAQFGLTAFTIRNGMKGHPLYAKPYAEKLLFVLAGQHTPFHFHFHKMEDIINRGGGQLLIRLYNSTPDEQFANTPVRVCIDGELREVSAGGVVALSPGQSITLTPGLYHEFWVEADDAATMAGEVSMYNDDISDNRFYHAIQRFAEIEEDEPPLRLLCNEYPKAD